jgi:hypothetical protein
VALGGAFLMLRRSTILLPRDRFINITTATQYSQIHPIHSIIVVQNGVHTR